MSNRAAGRIGKLVAAGLATVALMSVAQPEASAGNGANGNGMVSYFGTNLFLGLAYHRWGCAFNGPYTGSTVSTNSTYQGFTGNQYCVQGQTWQTVYNNASTYLSYTQGGNKGDDWLGYYYGIANSNYGLGLGDGSSYCHSWATGYADNRTQDVASRSNMGPNQCSYNVLTNCNSDCWIRAFSSNQGATVSISSPCF